MSSARYCFVSVLGTLNNNDPSTMTPSYFCGGDSRHFFNFILFLLSAVAIVLRTPARALAQSALIARGEDAIGNVQ